MQNDTIIPIERPTTPYVPPTGGSNVLANDPLILWGIGIAIVLVLIVLLLRRWAKKQAVRTLDEVNPSLSDLNSGLFSLNTYLAIQGGLAIVISVVCTLSIVFILVNPLITILTCASAIFGSGYVREKAMNAYRAGYKNRHNLEGYLRNKKGDKKRYNWSDIKFMQPYTNDEEQYQKLKVEITKLNADKQELSTAIKAEIDLLVESIETLETEVLKLTIAEEAKADAEPEQDEEGKDLPIDMPDFDALTETLAPYQKTIKSHQDRIIELGETFDLSKEGMIDLDALDANPILINNNYLVIVVSRGMLKNNLDFVDWFDYDIFGEFQVPCAGPELREITTLHRVKDNPNDDKYRMDEYIPCFVSIFDDRQSRNAIRPLEAIDMETNDIIAALAKAMGVERKHTAGEINTSKALTGDLLNEDRDFELLVEARSDAKALKIIDAEKKLKSLDKIAEYITPGILTMLAVLVLGIFLGYMWGQNSILVGIGVVVSGFLNKKQDTPLFDEQNWGE